MPYPKINAVHTASQICSFDLLDSPFFRFCVDGAIQVIQTCHLTDEELLSVPGFAGTRWRYERTTEEWIPLFRAVDDTEILACVDIEPDVSPFSRSGELWVTPKGFPRKQYSCS
jgi:hypothetical protein